ncbi:hypothetical protein BST61_g7027 [Cercospora zeina]
MPALPRYSTPRRRFAPPPGPGLPAFAPHRCRHSTSCALNNNPLLPAPLRFIRNMGSYNFTWSHPADEVYVTGTFDNWSKSVKLDKKDQLHEKLVNLPTTEKVFYKFVADGTWSHDHTAKTETDHEGNLNNVLLPEDIQPVNSMAHNLSSVAPGATTASLAGQQPLEKEKDQESGVAAPAPGAFPETPAADAPEPTFSINPIPASAGIGNPISVPAGEQLPDQSTFNNNTIASTVRDDPSLKSSTDDQTVSVAPLPATSGIGNPITLAPGEKVPDSSTFTSNTIHSNVKLDKASYENSGASVPAVPETSANDSDAAASAAIVGGLGPQTTNMIPESSLGMGEDAPAPIEGQAISSVGPTSTTNQLAGQVPLEPRGVPEVVKESQHEAGVSPEASANPEAVAEKKETEAELKDKIGKPEDQTSSAIGGALGGAAAGAGAAALGAAAVARQKTHEITGTDPVSVLPASVQKTVDENTKPSGGDTTRTAADAVPIEVKESQKEAHVAPEASANPEAVHEKADVEKELLQKVPESQAGGDPAPTVTAATTAVAPAAETTSSTGAPQLGDPTAGVAALSMDDKSKELNAPATSQAQPRKPIDSRDVSPMSKPNPAAGTENQTAPVVTTGVNSSEAPAASKPVGTPRTGASPSTPGKRNSIMDRLMGSKEGTPDSTNTEASSTKKKGRFSRLIEKLKN